eukprot:CAMPEP_0183351000 /NCGR_PEP_ID=MMETSP0164_2-20130417/22925_1 /TAXON_ID=221442 /ORGANISM="Coccolithus pelagicus ssp braarudi, Strain PLY182g" /LENGTH=49 /DNA_ID=CAMNT_0025523071 /DNA_START=79 /DNA_END=228 /DNA_ORIENTATION=+
MNWAAVQGASSARSPSVSQRELHRLIHQRDPQPPRVCTWASLSPSTTKR